MDFIVKQCVFGEVRCWMYSIEWLKRGLPHSHTLIWLVDKIRPDQLNDIISAEILDSEFDPELFEIVTTNGRTISMKVKGNNVVVDNSWIVPYSPLLSKTFKAHCNVEFCNSIKSIKYVCKYVNKGSDMAVFGIAAPDANDEVTRYQLGRYVSCNEAI